MSIDHAFGWRDRTVALAAVGAAAVSRPAFAPCAVGDPQPLEMQVLVSLALQDSLVADEPLRTGTSWLSLALHIEEKVAEEIVRRLVERKLVVYRSDVNIEQEIPWELGDEDDENELAAELPIALTDLGLATVDRWILHARAQFGGWPPDRPDVDDVID